MEPLASPRFFPVKPRLETLVGPVGHALSNLSLGRVTLTVWIPRFLMTGAPNLKQRQPCRSPKRPSNGLPPKASFAVLRASAPGIRPLPVAVEPLASPRFFPVKPRLETLVGPVGHALSNLSLGRVTLTVWIPRFLMTGAPNLKQRQPCRSPKRPSNGLPPKASFAVLRASAPASARFPSRWSRLLRRASSR